MRLIIYPDEVFLMVENLGTKVTLAAVPRNVLKNGEPLLLEDVYKVINYPHKLSLGQEIFYGTIVVAMFIMIVSLPFWTNKLP